MQTRVYIKALNDIIDSLRLREIERILRAIDEDRGSTLSAEVKSIFSDLVFGLDSGFNRILEDPVLRTVAEGLDLEKLLSRNARTSLLTSFQGAATNKTVADNRLFAQLYISARTILRLNDALQSQLAEDLTSSPGTGLDEVVLEIEDYDNDGIALERLQIVIGAILSLYNALERQESAKPVTPLVRWIDSGSNITISIEGAAEVISEVRKLFAGLWRGIRFAKNEKVERDVETALKQLELIRELDRLAEAGGESGERAAHARHAVMKSMSTLLGAGVMPVEVEGQTTFSRSEVLAAVKDTRLLASGTSNHLSEPSDRPGATPET